MDFGPCSVSSAWGQCPVGKLSAGHEIKIVPRHKFTDICCRPERRSRRNSHRPTEHPPPIDSRTSHATYDDNKQQHEPPRASLRRSKDEDVRGSRRRRIETD